MSRTTPIALVALIAAAAILWFLLFKDRVTVSLDVPEAYGKGALVVVTGTYELNGRQESIRHFRGFTTGERDLELRLARHSPWHFRQLRVDVGHPRFRAASAYAEGNPHWFHRRLTLSPAPWADDFDETFVQPEEDKTVAALDHLRWINKEYLRDADRLLATEVLLEARMVLGSLAYAGGSKEPGWEALRQQTIAEFEKLDAELGNRTDEPCPDGHNPDQASLPPCGRNTSSVIWPE